jgi:hypothetical protein
VWNVISHSKRKAKIEVSNNESLRIILQFIKAGVTKNYREEYKKVVHHFYSSPLLVKIIQNRNPIPSFSEFSKRKHPNAHYKTNSCCGLKCNTTVETYPFISTFRFAVNNGGLAEYLTILYLFYIPLRDVEWDVIMILNDDSDWISKEATMSWLYSMRVWLKKTVKVFAYNGPFPCPNLNYILKITRRMSFLWVLSVRHNSCLLVGLSRVWLWKSVVPLVIIVLPSSSRHIIG